jgi:hypothetical protein
MFYRFVTLMRFEFQGGRGMAIRKEVYRQRGARCNPALRGPAVALDEPTRQALDRVLVWTSRQEGGSWILD